MNMQKFKIVSKLYKTQEIICEKNNIGYSKNPYYYTTKQDTDVTHAIFVSYSMHSNTGKNDILTILGELDDIINNIRAIQPISKTDIEFCEKIYDKYING